MEIMEKVINNGKTCLLLIPEITLTNQILARMSSRFSRIAVLHSGLSDGERYDEYRKIKRGEIDLVIGARSSIFAPLKNIGVIIIDECHTESFMQDVMPKYDAINIAKHRCHYHNCPLILGSATPTLEQFARASKGVYELLTLTKRAGNANLPNINIVDMTNDARVGTIFSQTLINKIFEKLNKHEQIILLQNRRGYSSILMCPECGYTMKCPNCDISLTYHKTKDIMRCHYCGYATKKNKHLPNMQK
jgi:primosomal protein N' (replication factor Y)